MRSATLSELGEGSATGGAAGGVSRGKPSADGPVLLMSRGAARAVQVLRLGRGIAALRLPNRGRCSAAGSLPFHLCRQSVLFLINIQMERSRAVERGQSRYNRRMERRMAVLFKGLL